MDDPPLTAATPGDSPDLRIWLLGGWRVTAAGRAVPDRAWTRRSARRLIKLLALAPGHHLLRDHVLDTLWPEVDPDAAGHRLRQAVYAARRALAPTAPPDRYLRLDGDLLRLTAPGVLWVDVAAFEAAVAAARQAGTPVAALAALDLYRGDLLPEDAYEDWAADRRDVLRREYVTLLLALARLHEDRGAPADAMAVLQRVLASEPEQEAAHQGMMRLYAATGQRHQALRQYDRLRDVLRRDLDVEPELASQALHAAILAGRRADADTAGPHPDRPTAPHPPQLPAPLTSFIGRARDLAEVGRWLNATRLLTLTGTGGCGKSRLALEAARAAQADYPDGVWLVELAAVVDPGLVPQAVARGLGLPDQPGRSPTERLAAWVADKFLLLVLDNCEHVVDTCATLVAAVLRAGPRLRILATSREPLGIGGEVIWRVPSLSLPGPGHAAGATEAGLTGTLVGQAEAAQLFVARAAAAWPDFRLTDRNAPAVAQICWQLDGIPLALELAAAWVRVLTVEQIAARLDDRFRLLTGGSQTALPRHRTLRATLDWSHALLTGPEQAVFRRLAVFVGGWTLEAAEAVGAGDGIGADAMLDLLTRLVDKSLVQAEATGATARYRLLETVRAYGWERLRAAGEESLVRSRHLTWCRALAERAGPAVWGGEQLVWLARLDAEHDNLRAALAWCLEHDAEAGLALASSLWPYWRVRSFQTEGRRWLEGVLARAPARTGRRVTVLLGAGRLAGDQGDLATARARFEEGLAISRELGDARLTAWTLRQLGYQVTFFGEHAAAQDLLEEALPLARSVGDQRGLGTNLMMLGRVAEAVGAVREARAWCEESTAVLRAVGDRWMIAYSVRDLGRAVLSAGDAAAATALFDEGLALAQAVDSPWLVGGFRLELGRAAEWWGDLAGAAEHYGASRSLARAVDDAAGLAWALAGLGRVAHRQGDAERAARLLQESLTLHTRQQSRPGIAEVQHGLGLVAWARGESARAVDLLQASLRARQAMGERPGVAAGLEALALVASASGHRERTARLLGAAETLRRTLGVPQPPVERPATMATVRAARVRLGHAPFAVARAAGRKLPVEHAVAEALSLRAT